MGNENLTSAAKELGKKGGKATLKKFGKKHFKNLSKKGTLARWGKSS